MLYSSFTMVTKLRTGWCRVCFLAWAKHFSPLLNTQIGYWAHRASCSVGTRRYFAWYKVAGTWCCHASPSGAVVKNLWSCTWPPPTCHCKFVLYLVWFLQYNVSCLVFAVVVFSVRHELKFLYETWCLECTLFVRWTFVAGLRQFVILFM
jgi:hypothetical protein